jgi:hypothetical protein
MAGVNLSQSITADEKAPKSVYTYTSGMPISVGLLVLTLIGWGGMRWYMYSLDNKINQVTSDITASSSALQDERVDRVTNFDARLSLLNADPAESIDPTPMLSELETLIVPQVTLKSYAYDQTTGETTIAGKTNNFRYVAEQIISLKSSPSFSRVEVQATSRTEGGAIEFILKASKAVN